MSIDLANETENRLLKSGKDKEIVSSPNSCTTFENVSSTLNFSSARIISLCNLWKFMREVHCKPLIYRENEVPENVPLFCDECVIELPKKAL